MVIALICGLLVVILMVLGLASADWLMAAGWRQGLFMHCIDPEAPTPLPFDITAQPGCYAARPAPYIKAAAGLCVATLAADVCGALLTGLGLRSADHRTKFRYYRFAVLAMALALMCILIALVIYPVCFAAELNLGNRSVWEFGWAYGVGWGAAIFLFGAVILLLCDKESEELYYKERKWSSDRSMCIILVWCDVARHEARREARGEARGERAGGGEARYCLTDLRFCNTDI
ncbi:jg15049 [Pararge aegeria aegeria]|uniref:Jg15049 protein n=1 Tax=Pararge aegeria aegeria TaxID=348720 RepID=A0A8S4SPD7_9NEOP|nr:jg15049 [Pararge aegeria aegeria]